MFEMQSGLLWIGNANDVRQPEAVFDAEIVAVVDVAMEEPVVNIPRQLTYCRFPLNDGGGNELRILRQAISTVADFIQSETRTLVACSAGMSRSPTVAAFALGLCFGEKPEEIINRIAGRKALQLHPLLWADMQKAYDTLA